MVKGGNSRRNRKTRAAAVQRVKELQEKHGLTDPIEILMLLANGVEPDPLRPGAVRPILAGVDPAGNPIYGAAPEVRERATAALLNYLYSKKKRVVYTGNEGNPIYFVVAPDLSPLPSDTPPKAKSRASDGEFRV